MKTLFRNKMVMTVMVVALVAIFLTAGGVIAGPPAHGVGEAAYITLDPSDGFPGDLINVCGYSFTAEEWVDIYYDGHGGTWLGDIETDEDGDFTFSFEVPESCEGDHFVLAEDGYGSTAYASFTVLSRINYQGQLTDSGGNPLSGTYDMEFRFYRSATGSGQAGSAITRNDVEVANGLFSVKLDVDRYGFERYDLWLEVTVEGETLSPRQEILPVPYALSLKPGATIYGSDHSSVLTVYSMGGGNGLSAQSEDGQGVWGYSTNSNGVMGETDSGWYGVLGLNWGEGYGVKGETGGSAGVLGRNTGSGVGVSAYSASGAAISATGTGIIESTADSYIFISGNSFIKAASDDTTRWNCQYNGAVLIRRGNFLYGKTIYIPITVPGVLYGQEVTVEELTIYYKCEDGSKNYIDETYLYRQGDADPWEGYTIVFDPTDRTSNTATSYTLSLTNYNVLSSDQGILSLRLNLQFVDDTNYIQIRGVRLRLSHS